MALRVCSRAWSGVVFNVKHCIGVGVGASGMHAGCFSFVQLRNSERDQNYRLSERKKSEPQPWLPNSVQSAADGNGVPHPVDGHFGW